MPNTPVTRRVIAIAAVFLAAVLYGCGQSGPLYLPGNPSEVQVPPPAESSATAEEEDDDEARESRTR